MNSFVVLALVALAFFFAPTLIAITGGKRNALAIFAVNLLLGLTGVGWLCALIWSLVRDPAAPVLAGPFETAGAPAPGPSDAAPVARTIEPEPTDTVTPPWVFAALLTPLVVGGIILTLTSNGISILP